MTPEQISLVQSSFAKVAPIADEAATLFYARLFQIAPDVRPLFKGDLEDQGRKLMAALGTVVRSLDRLDDVLPAVKALAVRHADYGVEPEHYAPVGAALLWTLKQGLGEAFTAETAEAWHTAYGLLSNTMIAAATAPSDA
ncbi:globin family protein [uncultured Methylovirgula sp.]|uniref:globin family protein n=1 Tax=uncultured Methylovirgula sp. TaxID=1285960 RepID=UPI00261E89E9|nr:globin family protein [uncultured Methylovirgula sp.]